MTYKPLENYLHLLADLYINVLMPYLVHGSVTAATTNEGRVPVSPHSHSHVGLIGLLWIAVVADSHSKREYLSGHCVER